MNKKAQMITIFFSLFLILAIITILGIESVNLNTNENVNSLIQEYNLPKLQYYFFLYALSNVNSLTISNGTYNIIYSTLQNVYLNELQNVNVSAVLLNTSNVVIQLPQKPENLVSYVPITLFNLQNQATPNPFQQMINITSVDNGWQLISTDNFGQNVEFFYSNGTVIPSWLENYTSSSAIWWLKLGSIPASSSFTVYMGLASKSANLFNNTNDGESSQLSPVRGEYNDIADVMNQGLLYQFYQLNGGGMQSQTSVYQAQLTPNSVFSYGSLTATAGPTLYQSGSLGNEQDVDGTNEPNVIIDYQYDYSGGSAFPNPPISNPQYVIMKAIGFVVVNSQTTIYGLTDDGMGIGYSNSGGALIPWLGGSSTSNNPNNIINAWVGEGATQYGGTITTDGTYRIEIDYTNQGGPGEDAVWSNAPVDYYSPSQPPNGVMPSVGFGSDLP
jgi:hypothetical protein